MTVEFAVRDESGQPIDGADIQIRSLGGFYAGGRDEKPDKPIELRTDALGRAYRQCLQNWCIGRRSGLRFTNTYVVYIPDWHVSVFADSYEPNTVSVASEYRSKNVIHEGPQNDRLTIQIVLKRLGAS